MHGLRVRAARKPFSSHSYATKAPCSLAKAQPLAAEAVLKNCDHRWVPVCVPGRRSTAITFLICEPSDEYRVERTKQLSRNTYMGTCIINLSE
eukprot:SAG11_NODE_1152_length_5663_cov_110.803379_1_plen_93_part_00